MPYKNSKSPVFIIAQLNGRIMPIHREEFFEDPLNQEIQKLGIGEVSGGGCLQNKNGEIVYCDIEIRVPTIEDKSIEKIIEILTRLGAPKGSTIIIESEGRKIPFGGNEGLAIYLNGTDLPENVYKECDSNFVYSELDRIIAGQGRVLSYWQGPTETAFYLYGKSFSVMKNAIASFVASYPLCQKSRIEQIA